MHDGTGGEVKEIEDNTLTLPTLSDVSDDSSPAALPYVHQEPVQVAVPVSSPVLSYAYSPVVTAYTAGKVAVVSPYLYAHTGCVNSVGSVVPCHV